MKKNSINETVQTNNLEKRDVGWRKIAPWAIAITMGFWVASGLHTAKNRTEYKVEEFSQMPVLLNGRVQPWDSVAKNSLLMLRGKASVPLTEKPLEELSFSETRKLKKMSAMEWLLEAMTRPQIAVRG